MDAGMRVRRLECLECGEVADERAVGWKAYLGSCEEFEDDVEVGIFCPACAEREFEYG